MATLSNGEAVIHAGNAHEFRAPVVGGEWKARGLIPRDYSRHPVGSYPWATAVDFPLIPRSEWSARLKDMIAAKALLSDVRMTGGPGGGMIPARDQDGKGYCWAHSGVSAHLMVRAVMGEPYADLSAYGIACIIKGYADEGGWGAQGLDWQVQNGCPTSATWPQQSMSRSNDTPAMRQEAAQHKIVAQWADLDQAQYDRTLTFDQVATLLLSGVPVVTDFNWWSHSVCGIDLVDGNGEWGNLRMPSGKRASLQEFESVLAIRDPVTGGFSLRILNSWGDGWSKNGTGVLSGNQAIPDGAVAPRIALPSGA